MPFDMDPAPEASPPSARDRLDGFGQDMRIAHEMLLTGPCEWVLLAQLGAALQGSGARLDRVRQTRFEGRAVALSLTIADITEGEIRRRAGVLARSPGVALCRIEHSIARTRPVRDTAGVADR